MRCGEETRLVSVFDVMWFFFQAEDGRRGAQESRGLGEVYKSQALVKPQFEVGREHVGGGGVVRDPGHRRRALIAVGAEAVDLGAAVIGYVSSGLPGPKGNRESFVWLAEASRGGLAAGELEAAARKAEP